jgi:hypothetical protein
LQAGALAQWRYQICSGCVRQIRSD